MKDRQFTIFLYAMVSFSLIGSLSVNATPLSLSTTPLVVSGAAEPNIMLLLDNSGSMSNIVPESPYDENTNYKNNCSYEADDAQQVDIRVQPDGDVYFSNGSDYDFGNDADTGITGKAKKCFDGDTLYKARLLADSSVNVVLADSSVDVTKVPGSYLPALYTGNFLNWYLSDGSQTDGANFGTDAQRRPGTSTRMEIAKTAAESLVDGLDNVRMGLATYNNSGVGGLIREGIDDISSNKAALKTSISSLTNDSATPIAETLETLGRYFIQGHESADITLHPGSVTGTEAVKAANAVFSHSPAYDSGVAVPTSVTPVIQYFCQKNFIIALTDGRPQFDQTVDDDLQDYDGDCAATPTDCDEFNAYDKKDSDLGYEYEYDYESAGSDYLDDVLLALYDIDLRPDLVDFDGTGVLNNIISYLIGFADIQVQNDPLMVDAAAAGGGGSFLTATSGDDLTNTFADIINDVLSQVGSVASVAFNSSQLNSGSAVFQAQFNTARWSGSLLAFPLSLTGDIGAQVWEAAEVLGSMSVSDRHIFSYSTDSSEGIEFVWANLSAEQKADLYRGVDADGDANSTDGNSTNDDDDAQLLINYLLGDNALEGTSATQYRARESRLGDIVNSTPVFISEPQLAWPEFAVNDKFGASGDDYSTFKAGAAASRTPVIYVGANDGMLHGFNAEVTGTDGGKELMAYIPGIISSNLDHKGLHYLADTSYQHNFYVDLTPAVSDVYIERVTDGSKAWRTILVGGLRAGGRGYYALDITDPDEFSNPASNAANVVLWEFSSVDDADLGYTYSQPSIVMMANGKWAAVFGNGYNSGNERAVLFIVYIEEGVDGIWSASDYVKIDTDTSISNGLSTPRVVDMDGDSVADRIYAGDLNGNMWVFDVTDPLDSNWDVAYRDDVDPFDAQPLFTARNDSDQIQPITTAPILAKNINIATVDANEPNVLVLFGTGRFIEPGDVLNYNDVMSYYAVWDEQTSLLTRSDLVSRSIVTADDLRTVTGNAINWNTDHGWYLDLYDALDLDSDNAPITGERVVSDSLLRREVLFFNTIIPDDVACSAGGSGWLMALEHDTGLAPNFATFDADKDGSVFGDIQDLGKVGSRFSHGVPAQSGILGDKQYTPGSDGTIESRDIYVGTGGKEGRLSWQELLRN